MKTSRLKKESKESIDDLIQFIEDKSRESTQEPAVINNWFKRATPRLAEFNADQLIVCLEAVARIGQYEPMFLAAWVGQIIKSNRVYSADLSKVLTCLAKLEFKDQRFLNYYREKNSNFADNLVAKQLATAIHDIAKLQLFDEVIKLDGPSKLVWHNFITSLMSDANRKLSGCDIQDISNIIWGVNKLSFYDQELLDNCGSYIAQKMTSSNATCNDLIKIMSGVAKLGYQNESLVSQLVDIFKEKERYFSLRSKVNAVFYLTMICENHIINSDLKTKIENLVIRVLANIDFHQVSSLEQKTQLLVVMSKSINQPNILSNVELINQWQEDIRRNADPTISLTQNKVSNFIAIELKVSIKQEIWINESQSNVDIFVIFDRSKTDKKGLVVQVDGPTHYQFNHVGIMNATTRFNSNLLKNNFEVVRIKYSDIDNESYRDIVRTEIARYEQYFIAREAEVINNNRDSSLETAVKDTNAAIITKPEDKVPTVSLQVQHKRKAKKENSQIDNDQALEQAYAEAQAYKELSNKYEPYKDGLHTVVVTKDSNFFEGCIVHHSNSRNNFINIKVKGITAIDFVMNNANRKMKIFEAHQIAKRDELENSTIWNAKKFREASSLTELTYESINQADVIEDIKKFEILLKYNAKLDSNKLEDYCCLVIKCKKNESFKNILNEFNTNNKHDLMSSLFRHAARCNNLFAMKLIIDRAVNLNPNAIDAGGFTALHHAVVNGFKDVSEFLLNDLHVNPNTFAASATLAFDYNITPLFAAVYGCDMHAEGDEHFIQKEKDHRYIVDLLLEAGANTDVRAADGMHIMRFAIQSGCINFITKVIDESKINLRTTPLDQDSSSFASMVSVCKGNAFLELAKAANQPKILELLNTALGVKELVDDSSQKLSGQLKSIHDVVEDATKGLTGAAKIRAAALEKRKSAQDISSVKTSAGGYKQKIIDEKNALTEKDGSAQRK